MKLIQSIKPLQYPIAPAIACYSVLALVLMIIGTVSAQFGINPLTPNLGSPGVPSSLNTGLTSTNNINNINSINSSLNAINNINSINPSANSITGINAVNNVNNSGINSINSINNNLTNLSGINTINNNSNLNRNVITSTSSASANGNSPQCEYNDPKLGCTTCDNVIKNAQAEINQVLSTAQTGCSKDYECSLQSVSTNCGQSCLQPVVTSKSQLLSDKIMMLNMGTCDGGNGFQTTCSAQIPKVTSSLATVSPTIPPNSLIASSPTTNTQRSLSCGEEESYCQKSTGKCAKRNRLVAAATEVFAGFIAGIGSNPNGIDNYYTEPTGVIIATSTVPRPTSDNVSNVISNIPLPPGVAAPIGAAINRNN